MNGHVSVQKSILYTRVWKEGTGSRGEADKCMGQSIPTSVPPKLSSLLIIQSSCILKLFSYSWPAHEAKLRGVGRGKKIDEAVEKDEDLVRSQSSHDSRSSVGYRKHQNSRWKWIIIPSSNLSLSLATTHHRLGTGPEFACGPILYIVATFQTPGLSTPPTVLTAGSYCEISHCVSRMFSFQSLGIEVEMQKL